MNSFFTKFMYDMGTVVPKDSVKALYWFEKSAAQGDEGAQFNLGLIYFNLEEHNNALLWLLVSQLNGHDASNAIKIVREYLTTEAIRNADNMSKKCVESDYLICE